MKSLARQMRHHPTEAEAMLWKHLRDRRLAGAKFRRQVVIEPYIVDFSCFDVRLIVEVDGGQHLEQAQEDSIRTEYLETKGYTVMRFWNHEVLQELDSVLEQIRSILIETPSP